MGEINPTWVGAIPEESLESLYTIIKGATSRDELIGALGDWADTASRYWDELIASAPTPPQRFVWQGQETLQDTADISQAGKMSIKHGGASADEVDKAVKLITDGLTETERRLRTLGDIITDSNNPANRYAIYNAWGQLNDMKASMRTRQMELAEAANMLTGAARRAAWREYFPEVSRMWQEYSVTANKLLDDAAEGIARGDDFTPQLHHWDFIERTARKSEDELWKDLRLEPQGGTDARLPKAIEAGRAFSDKAIARTYAAARRFADVDAMDYIISAEHSVQMAGAQVAHYIAKAREAALKSGKIEDFYSIRNEAWRQLRVYEKQVWEDTTRHIVRDGIGAEANTGLRFDAGPDGIVELVGPRVETGQASNRLGPQREVTTEERTMWDVRREDGSITQLPDNYIPDDLKKSYNGVSDSEIEATVELELDNIASVHPYVDEAQEMIDEESDALEILRMLDEHRSQKEALETSADTEMIALRAELDDLKSMRKEHEAGLSVLQEIKSANESEDYALALEKMREFAEVMGMDASQVDAIAKASGIDITPMRSLDFTVPSVDFDALAEKIGVELNLGGLWGKLMGEETAKANKVTTYAGGATAGELSHGAAYAKQQLENIVRYLTQNADEIVAPGGRMIGEGQTLRAIDAFKREVVPAWDNTKYIAAEFGNRMRSFTMVDFANNTRLDEIMGLYMPYGFWATRTIKNSMERAIFEPHIYRRIMQAEREMRAMQEQEGVPHRYEGTIPVDTGDGNQYYLRLLPSKWWPTAGLFTMNDYADPESANSAIGFAVESLRGANLSSFPWWDAATKLIEGKKDEIYPAQYIPQGRIAADVAIMMFGADAASRWTVPGYFENSVARTLNNMAVDGEITRDEARWAHDYMWQLKNGGEPLPESETGAYDEAALEIILDKAMRTTAGIDLQSAVSSYLTGVSVRPFDDAEKVWTGAMQDYRNFKYGPANPYGSKLGADTQKPDAQLGWSKSGVWRDEEERPGVSMSTDAKKAERDAINEELMEATDEFIRGFDGTPKNYQINEFKNEWMAKNYGGSAEDYFVENISAYLDEKYPSATTFDGEDFQHEGYAPEEVRQAARRSAYYRAKEEIEQPVYPDWPGDDASYQEKSLFFEAKEKYDQEKKAYEQALEDRVNELIEDPQEMLRATGRYVMNEKNRMVNDFTRSQPQTLDDVFGYPVRPTGADAIDPGQAPMTREEYLAQQQQLAEDGELWDTGLTTLAGDPEDGEAIIKQERTKYMSDLEKETREKNDEEGKSGRRNRGRGGWVNYDDGDSRGGRRYYPRRSYGRRYYPRRYYSRRSYGSGGGSAGGNYYVPQVDPREFPSWLMPDTEVRGYRAPYMDDNDLPRIGPTAMKAWRPISWR